jgi:phosphate uptake regulator
MLCYLNGFEDAKELLFEIQNRLKTMSSRAYQNHKDSLRILRKIKYH